jgi:uncharacterized protein GlcG (DUF336 family)
MDGAPVRSILIAKNKSYTSVRMGLTTEDFFERLHQDKIEISYYGDPFFTALPGGAPLKNENGTVIGGVGISGLLAAEDQSVADYTAGQFLLL